MKLLVILALISIASAIPGCAYFQNAEACFSGTFWGRGGASGIPYCKVYGADPWTCTTCFPGYEWSTTTKYCVPTTTYLNWTLWPKTADASTQSESQNCNSWYAQYAKAIQVNYEGAPLAYTWDYANMSCVISGQQICMNCISGYRWDASATPQKCVTCPLNCKTCSLVGTTNTCSVCASSYFLSSGACSTCGLGQLTCTAVDKALTCLPGYFKDGDKCTACGGGLLTVTCTNATTDTVCYDGAYIVTGKCTICPQSNIGTCSGVDAAGILSCETDPDPSNTIYKNDVCQAHPSSNMCLTLLKTASTYYCGSCFSGYVRTGGACVTYESLCLYNADALTYATACNAMTNASLLTSITVGCKTGYYLEGTSGVPAGATGKCRKCSNSTQNCGAGSSCTVNTPTTLNVLCMTAATGYYLAAGTAPQLSLPCATWFGAGCLTCDLATNGCLTVDTGYFRCHRKIGSAGPPATGNQSFALWASCSKTYGTGPAQATDSLDASAGVTTLSVTVTSCKYYELDTGNLTATVQYNCTECDRTGSALVVVTQVSPAGSTTRTTDKQQCLQGGDTAESGTAHPVKLLKFKHCLYAYTSEAVGGYLASVATNCARCDTTKSFFADNGCTAASISGNNCILFSSAIVCQTCAANYIKETGGLRCALMSITGCSTFATPAAGSSGNATCDTCIATSVKTSDSLYCRDCQLRTNYAKCVTFAISSDDTQCNCVTCSAGYYVDSTTSGDCSNANSDTSKNCYALSTTMTGTWACAVCNYGYKLVSGACTLCSTANAGCVYTGCASQAYIGKTNPNGNTTTSYSSIISFIIMTLVSLLTFMI